MTSATPWLSQPQLAAWIRLIAVLELLPGALDGQLRRDADLSHYEHYALAMLSEADGHTLRMTELAQQTNATLPRLSHVVSRLEDRGLVERFPCPDNRRATNVRLTDAGWAKVLESAPGHVALVRQLVIDALDDEQIEQLRSITEAILERLDPEGSLAVTYRRYDSPSATSPKKERAL